MNRSLYNSPLRVYFLLAALALAGILCGLKLPVSLFPNSTKPKIWVEIPYGSLSPEEFLNTYGKDLEDQIRTFRTEDLSIESLDANYERRNASYEISFRWGASPETAQKEMRVLVNSFASRLPEESREGTYVEIDNENAGFFAVSFFSSTRDLNSLYDVLDPILTPKARQVADAQDPVLFNPTSKEIRIDLNPDALAALQLLPRDIERAIKPRLEGYAGGSVTTGTKQFHIEVPRPSMTADDLLRTSINSPSGRMVQLSDVARIDVSERATDSRSFKTNGAPSIILFASPKPGGNIKRMSEEMLAAVESVLPLLPKDIEHRVLVDPSTFIRSAIDNVLHEVGIAALLAVLVLLVFIGSFRNVITAAIEIPLSMILAFILMRIFGINLNLISLGGLALSAGMNVDASVVVMENIFRHFDENPGRHTAKRRLELLIEAVNQVRIPILASTVASLLVFLPLIFTSDLSYAILGDLALAVVFSHGFSAIVALVLVPTVRLHLMQGGHEKHTHSRFESQIQKLEDFYGRVVLNLISKGRLRLMAYVGTALGVVLMVALVLPRLPREIVGIPDTDWMILAVNTEGNTFHRQMESQLEEVESRLLKKFGVDVSYTFSQLRSANRGSIMARIKDKKKMRTVWQEMEKEFLNTPVLKFHVMPWNPSELPIPDPPHLKVAIAGGNAELRGRVARELSEHIEEKKLFPRVWSEPNIEADRGVSVEPYFDQWNILEERGIVLEPSDLADFIRVATRGKQIGYLPMGEERYPIRMRFPADAVKTPEDLGALPLGIGSRLVPLRALAQLKINHSVPTIYRRDGQELCVVFGKLGEGEKHLAAKKSAEATTAIEKWLKDKRASDPDWNKVSVIFEDPNSDLTVAITQLTWAVIFSIALIFITLLVQFGSIVEPLIVMVSVPVGLLGVILSLWVFQSTLSLNSILGIILLNGLSVANGILLVDFAKKLHAGGKSVGQAVVEASTKRLRPILITSLTTILGMLPIAVGMGEGGRILQPLGIAVTGGLWVSAILTLILVPSLQAAYLRRQDEVAARRQRQSREAGAFDDDFAPLLPEET